MSDLLEHNDAYCAAMARLVYLRRPERIPAGVEEQAWYYKHFYNSLSGGGSETKYLEDWRGMNGQELAEEVIGNVKYFS